MITGRCECGSIQYQVDGEINDYSHCHCSQCRRIHGAAFASFGGVFRSEFSYVSDSKDLATYASSSNHERLFCKNCGSNILVSLEEEPESYFLSMGSVDGNPACPPEYHIFVGSKAPWFSFNNAAPQYDTLP